MYSFALRPSRRPEGVTLPGDFPKTYYLVDDTTKNLRLASSLEAVSWQTGILGGKDSG